MAERRYADWVKPYIVLRNEWKLPPLSSIHLSSLARDPYSKIFLDNWISYLNNRPQIDQDNPDTYVAVVEGKVITSKPTFTQVANELKRLGVYPPRGSSERPFSVSTRSNQKFPTLARGGRIF